MSDVSNEDAMRIPARILARMSPKSRACRVCRRVCHEDAIQENGSRGIPASIIFLELFVGVIYPLYASKAGTIVNPTQTQAYLSSLSFYITQVTFGAAVRCVVYIACKWTG